MALRPVGTHGGLGPDRRFGMEFKATAGERARGYEGRRDERIRRNGAET